MQLLLINHDTTLSAFKKEIRWNVIYYLLADGLR
jgi:L-arabinose isomerase